MKKNFLVCGLAALMALVACNQNASNTPAENTANPEESVAVAGSIVYFDMDKVMQGYDMANDLNSVFETKASGIQAEIDRRGKKLEKDAADFQSKVDKGLLTNSVAQVQYQKLGEQQQSYQQYVLTKQQEMNEEQQVMINQIMDSISSFVQEFNQEHNYALILATSSANNISAPVVTGDPRLDITDQILAGLNAAYIKSKENK
jgi:outer membrane protein